MSITTSEVEDKQPPIGRPTLQDVAARAGVSIVTVSRVINNSPLVRAKLSEKVQAAIKELSYVAPAMEKRIKKRRATTAWRAHQTIGLILAGVFDFKWICDHSPVYSYVIQGIQNALRELNFGLAIHQVPKLETLTSLPRHLRVDGLIFLSKSFTSQWPEELKQYPIVTVMGALLDKPCDHISYDNVAVGRVAADFFLSRGLNDVAVIYSNSGPRDILRERADSFIQQMHYAGGAVLPLQRQDILRYGKDTHEMDDAVLREFIDQFAAQSPMPKGLFLTLDMMAPLVYRLLQEKGIRPGHDVQIIGCNNERPFLAGLDPRPVTIDIEAEKIGHRAVQQLIWRMQNRDEPYVKILIEPSQRF